MRTLIIELDMTLKALEDKQQQLGQERILYKEGSPYEIYLGGIIQGIHLACNYPQAVFSMGRLVAKSRKEDKLPGTVALEKKIEDAAAETETTAIPGPLLTSIDPTEGNTPIEAEPVEVDYSFTEAKLRINTDGEREFTVELPKHTEIKIRHHHASVDVIAVTEKNEQKSLHIAFPNDVKTAKLSITVKKGL